MAVYHTQSTYEYICSSHVSQTSIAFWRFIARFHTHSRIHNRECSTHLTLHVQMNMLRYRIQSNLLLSCIGIVTSFSIFSKHNNLHIIFNFRFFFLHRAASYARSYCICHSVASHEVYIR